MSPSSVPPKPKANFAIYLYYDRRSYYVASMMKAIDTIDRRIISALESDGRASLAEIGKAVGLSGPAVGERLRRLQSDGIVEGFTVRVDAKAIGYSLEAIVRIKPRSKQLRIVEQMIQDEPRFTSCDRVTGDDCFVARLALLNIEELDDILLPLHELAETNTSIVKSSLFRNRMPTLSPETKPS